MGTLPPSGCWWWCTVQEADGSEGTCAAPVLLHLPGSLPPTLLLIFQPAGALSSCRESSKLELSPTHAKRRALGLTLSRQGAAQPTEMSRLLNCGFFPRKTRRTGIVEEFLLQEGRGLLPPCP